MKRHRSGERGQVIPVVALFLVILTGFLGIVIDGGTGYTHKRHDQDVSDAAALAAAYALYAGGGLSQARSAASEVATLDGCTGQCSLQPLTWYDSSNTQLGNNPPPSQVARVGALVNDTETTSFAHIDPSGSRSVSVAASAQALVKNPGSGGTVPCSLCLMGNLTVNAPLTNIVTTVGDLDINGNLTIAALSTTVTALGHHVNVSGGTYSPGFLAVVLPTPQRSPPPPPIADPLAATPVPDITGLADMGDYTYPSGQASATISPGVYHNINIGGSSAILNFNPGTYVITGGLNSTAASVILNGAGVLFYLGCNGPGTVPTCTPGQAGAGVTISSASVVMTLSAPTSGPDTGIVFFWDRNNTASFHITSTVFAGLIVGALYAISATVNLDSATIGVVAAFAAPVVADNLTMTGTTLNLLLDANALINSVPAGPGGLTQ